MDAGDAIVPEVTHSTFPAAAGSSADAASSSSAAGVVAASSSSSSSSGARAERRKGRGARPDKVAGDDDRYTGPQGVFESLDTATEGGPGAAKSVEGWILMITGVHEEASEDQILDAFADFGRVRNIAVNLDRRTGFTKGYALLEYAAKDEAEAAIVGMQGKQLLGNTIHVDWAFVKGDRKGGGGGGGGGRRR